MRLTDEVKYDNLYPSQDTLLKCIQEFQPKKSII